MLVLPHRLCLKMWERINDSNLGIDLVATDVNGDRESLNILRSNKVSDILGIGITPNQDKRKIVKHLRPQITGECATCTC